MLKTDLLDAIITLGPNMFYGAGLAACILVVRRRKAAERKGRILLIDGSDIFSTQRNQNTLTPEHARQIANLYHAPERDPTRCRSLTIDEVAAQRWSLNVTLYLGSRVVEPLPDLHVAFDRLRTALEATRAAETNFMAAMRAAGDVLE